MGTDKVFDFIFIALVAFTIAVMGAYRMRYKIESKTVQRVIGVLTACLGIKLKGTWLINFVCPLAKRDA